MSNILKQGHNREKCQKFTPPQIVNEMLNLIGYSNELFGKKVLEYSFGTGNILVAIVNRYISDAINRGFSNDMIAKGLSSDIYGIELDEELFSGCVERLNTLTREKSIPSVQWQLFCTDTLRWDDRDSFDYVIGNPPYISYHDIDNDNRVYLREKFKTCKTGKFDYCYAFIEKGLSLLSSSGKMCLLVPSNIYKNVYAHTLREHLRSGLIELREYPNNQLFGDTLTSSSIFLFDKARMLDSIRYVNATDNVKMVIKKEQLGNKWVFFKREDSQKKRLRFGDFFSASIAVATLLNEAFIIKDETANHIEHECTKIAAAPRTLRLRKEERIIFPYYYDQSDRLCKYSEDEFSHKFPLTYTYLKQFKEKLSKRDADKMARWYEYGRSQALGHLHQEKLLMSTIITTSVELYRLDVDCIPYSGIIITVKNQKKTLDDANAILKSAHFFEYAMSIGISINGKSKRISCKDINNYMFEEV